MKELQKIQCPVCGVSQVRALYDKNTVTIVKCETCGLAFNNPPLQVETLKTLLNGNYYKNPNIEYGYENYRGDKNNLILTFAKRIKIINKIYENNNQNKKNSLEKRRLLDIGCAYGYGLSAARNYGWDAYGVEISKSAADLAEPDVKSRIFNGELKEAKFPNDYFDVVTAWDVIQAYTDPLNEFHEINRILRTNGILAIAAINFNSLPERFLGGSWDQYKIAETNLYFSPPSLTGLLNKMGFEVIKIKPTGGGKYCSLKFIVNRLQRYDKTIYKALDFFIARLHLENTSFYVNPLGIMMVLAKKTRSLV